MKEHYVCDKCDLPHYNNCGTCEGFGLTHRDPTMEIVPTSPDTAEMMRDNNDPDIACPECGSTIYGIPGRERVLVLTE